MIMLYTDGSSLTPNGIGAWAYTLVAQVPKNEFATTKAVGVELASCCGACTEVTNNQMEVCAIMHGLNHARVQFDCTRGVTVISDSKYALSGITEWRDGWESRGLRTSSGQRIKNAELWADVWKSVDKCKFPVIYEHVRGHKGVFWNEYVDDLARNCALTLKEERIHLHDSRD